jgi:hypothetical protein
LARFRNSTDRGVSSGTAGIPLIEAVPLRRKRDWVNKAVGKLCTMQGMNPRSVHNVSAHHIGTAPLYAAPPVERGFFAIWLEESHHPGEQEGSSQSATANAAHDLF